RGRRRAREGRRPRGRARLPPAAHLGHTPRGREPPVPARPAPPRVLARLRHLPPLRGRVPLARDLRRARQGPAARGIAGARRMSARLLAVVLAAALALAGCTGATTPDPSGTAPQVGFGYTSP